MFSGEMYNKIDMHSETCILLSIGRKQVRRRLSYSPDMPLNPGVFQPKSQRSRRGRNDLKVIFFVKGFLI